MGYVKVKNAIFEFRNYYPSGLDHVGRGAEEIEAYNMLSDIQRGEDPKVREKVGLRHCAEAVRVHEVGKKMP